MRFVFFQNITCKDAGKCANTLETKLKTLLETTDRASYHISILHENLKHKVWVFTYDKQGIHESDLHDKLRLKSDHTVHKFTGKQPTLNQLKSKLTYSD